MKKLLMVLVVLATGVVSVTAFAAEEKSDAKTTAGALAVARGKIDKIIESPALMKEAMKGLSAEDQKAFLADVIKAISELPASDAEKAAKYIDIAHAALAGAAQGNVAALTAEIFATVPVEALSVLSEVLAKDTFNRGSYTIADYTKLAKEVMGEVNERCESTDNGSPRVALAIVMFANGLNGSEEEQSNLVTALVDTMKHADAQECARKEWIPAALGKDGNPPSYEAILAAADAGLRPDLQAVLPLTSGVQFHDATLADISGKFADPVSSVDSDTPILDAIQNKLIVQQAIIGGANPGAAGAAGGANAVVTQETEKPENVRPTPTPTPTPEPEPKPYQWQSAF